MKINRFLRILLFIVITIFVSTYSWAESLKNEGKVLPGNVIEIAKKYNCTVDKDYYKRRYEKIGEPYTYISKKKDDVVFWCKYIYKEIEKYKIVIHIESNATKALSSMHAYKCPREIEEVKDYPNSLSIRDGGIYSGGEDGFLYKCENGKWQSYFIH